MGRHSQGYRLRRQRSGPWSARFTVDGERHEVFTGERDRAAAERIAREAYAAALGGRVRRGTGRGALTPEVTGRWLEDLPVRPVTRALYEKYARYWLQDLSRLDEAAIAQYVRARLRVVRGKTLRSELSALRNLLGWMVDVGELTEAPAVPTLDHSRLGTPDTTRHRVAAPDYTEQEIRKVLRALPVAAPSGFAVRARFVVLYETGLRPSTVDALSVPEHWSPGARSLRLTDDVDKEGFARSVPLSPAAVRALASAAPSSGVIFGEHRYSRFVADAARVLPPHKAAVFTAQHLRSARATHLLDAGAPLPGVQYLLGHRHTATTSRYVRPSEAAARAALSGRISGRKRTK